MTTLEQIWVAPEAPVATPPTKRDVLHRAADLIEEFEHCKGDFARNSRGHGVWWHSSDVVAFCALGAIHRAHDDFGFDPDESIFAYSRPLARLVPEGHIKDWNDAPGRTRAEVVARLREAAEASHE